MSEPVTNQTPPELPVLDTTQLTLGFRHLASVLQRKLKDDADFALQLNTLLNILRDAMQQKFPDLDNAYWETAGQAEYTKLIEARAQFQKEHQEQMAKAKTAAETSAIDKIKLGE